MGVSRVALGLMLLCCCTPQPQPQPKPVLVTAEDCGRSVRADKGTPIRVTFKEVLGTGYRWQLERAPRLLHQEGVAKTESDREGEPGLQQRHIFVLISSQAGEDSLQFIYRRPWERPTQETKRCRIAVSIR
jgi:predicted secreted protein